MLIDRELESLAESTMSATVKNIIAPTLPVKLNLDFNVTYGNGAYNLLSVARSSAELAFT